MPEKFILPALHILLYFLDELGQYTKHLENPMGKNWRNHAGYFIPGIKEARGMLQDVELLHLGDLC